MTPSKKRPYTDAEALPESHDHLRKRPNRSHYAYHHLHQSNIPPTSNAPDADFNQLLLLPSPSLEGPGLPRPAYPSQINDLEPHPQDAQSTSIGYHQPEPNPSLNSYPEPWNQQFVSGGNFQYPVNRAYSSSWPRNSYPPGKPHHWPHSTSEVDCSVSGKYPPDSAYYTKSPATQSIFSGEFPTSSQHSLTGAMNAIELPSGQMPYNIYPTEKSLGFPTEVPPPCTEHQTENVPELVCKKCEPEQRFKNKSEFHKHKLRHDKPYKCEIAGCNRKEGFTTKNDLDRHKKSLHQVYTGKCFMCAAPHCAKKNKIWPRADNFRQHIVRLHPDGEVQELMDKSWERGCSVTQGDSGRGFVHSLGLCQQNIYEEDDDETTEHEMSYSVTLQEINKSSSIDSISNLYQQRDNGCSRAPSQDSINLYSVSSQDVGDMMDLDQEALNQYERVMISEDQYVSPAPEPDLTFLRSNSAKLSLPPKRKPLVIHHPKDCPESSAWTEIRQSQISNTDGSRNLADEASRTLASELSKAGTRNMEDMELIIRTRLLSLLSASESRKTSPQDSPCMELGIPEEGLECPYCRKKKKTQCDLTKHIKRHTRPYGCTFSKCPRRFGSKNDWKRHENTMHYQVEAWKCAEPKMPDGSNSTTIGGKHSATSKQCGRLCYRRESFMAHLHEAHGLGVPEKEDYVKEQCKKRRVGRNGQCGFWCGFCQTVVRLEKLGIEAWDERFNHIDDEHFKKDHRVEDWVPLEGEVPRGVAEMAEMGCVDPAKEIMEAEDRGSDEEDSGPDVEGDGGADVKLLEAGGLEEETAKVKADAMTRFRSSSKIDIPSGAREKVKRLWDCCQCRNAELSRDTDLRCFSLGCNHQRCPVCSIFDRRE